MLICSGTGKLLSSTVVECLSRNSMVLRNDLKRSMIVVLDAEEVTTHDQEDECEDKSYVHDV